MRSSNIGIEKAFDEYKPDVVLVYGDVNSSVAAALVASKLDLKVNGIPLEPHWLDGEQGHPHKLKN